MSRKYSPLGQAAALEKLQANGGNISLTALQTGIGERTLYTWRRRLLWQQRQQQTPSRQQQPTDSLPTIDDGRGDPVDRPPETNAPPSASDVILPSGTEKSENEGDPDDSTVFTDLRQQVVHHISALVSSLNVELPLATPYQRVLVLSQLLSHLRTIDAYLPDLKREQVIRVEYIDPDGTLHDTPIWQRDYVPNENDKWYGLDEDD